MNAVAPQIRKLLAALGAVLMVAALCMVVSNIKPTEASWADQVHGKSEISVGQPYARAVTTYGTMFPLASRDTNLGPNEAAAGAAKRGTAFDQKIDATDFSGLIGFLPMEAYGRSCARAGSSAVDCALPSPQSGVSSAYAVAETGQMKMWAGGGENVRLVTIGHARNLNSARTTAECRPGAQGIADLNRNAEVVLGGGFDSLNRHDDRGTKISMPALGGQSRGVWEGFYRYEGTLSHTVSTGINKASSQLRLHVRATTRVWPYFHQWTMDIILAHAECGAALRAPGLPDRPAQKGAMQTGMAAMRMMNPVLAQELPQLTSEADEVSESRLPTLSPPTETTTESNTDEPIRGEAVGSDPSSTAPATTVPDTYSPTSPDQPSSTAPATEEPSTPEDPATKSDAPQPTEQTAVAEGPQQPETVRVGREFAVVNRDGVELGNAKVEDIVRMPGCGAELTLSITTSDEAGPNRWATIEPTDFAEVRPGGSIRKASRLSSDCEQAATSRTTALSPGRDYEIVIAFQLSDTAQRAMLQPDGTAGWIFDLPPLPRVTVTTSAKAPAPASATTAAPATSSAPSTSATSEEPAAAAAEA